PLRSRSAQGVSGRTRPKRRGRRLRRSRDAHPRRVGRGVIVDPHHHLWVHATNPFMAPELRADTATVPDVAKTVFVECGSGYRSDGPEAYRPVGETDFVVAADPD